MVEDIIKSLADIVGLQTVLRLNEGGGFSAYVSSCEEVEKFLDGGALIRLTITLRGRGQSPSGIFAALERACAAVGNVLHADIGGVDVTFAVQAPPAFDSFGEKGDYSASCKITAEYIAECDKAKSKVWFECEDGSIVDMWRGNIRAVKIQGGMIARDITAVDNAFGDGGVIAGERGAVRDLRVAVRLCGEQVSARKRLGSIFRGGILHFACGNIQRKIQCCYAKTEYNITNLSDRAEITFLCAEPFFCDEDTLSAASGGIIGLWEFPWELPAEETFELSAVNVSPCAVIFNGGDVPCGFAAVINVQRDIKGLKIEEPVSGKCIEIKMDMLSGSKVHIDTREGRKSVTLYQTAENIPLDITSAVVYGSEFFPLQRGMNRVYFYDSDGGSVSAEIRCCALYGGI